MKAGEVLRILRISRSTLHRYASDGLIRRTKVGKHYDYSDEDVYKLLNKGVPRKNYVYARVSTSKQRKDLENQVEMLKMWCFQSGIRIDGIFTDVASGIDFDKRREFYVMLDDIVESKVDKVVIAYKDRLSRVGFSLFKNLFGRFGTEIVVVSEVGSTKLDSEEVFEEIVALLHCYSMKLYSKRRGKRLEVVADADSDSN
jgi:putative resolvase